MQIFVAARSGRKSCWKFFLEIFSWKFFLGARPKIFSFPKLGFGLFLSKGRRSFPISLSSLSRLKLSQICEDFYSENLGSEDLVFRGFFYYALIGHLSKILIWKLDACTSFSSIFPYFPLKPKRAYPFTLPPTPKRNFWPTTRLTSKLIFSFFRFVHKKKFHFNIYFLLFLFPFLFFSFFSLLDLNLF